MGSIFKEASRGFLGILAICLIWVLGAASGGGDITPIKSIEMLAEKDGLKAGESMRLAVRVSLSGEFHINSHVPSEGYLIPTTFELAAPEGLITGDWEFPKGQNKKFPFSETPLSVYEGTFVIHGSVRAAGNTPSGAKQARGTLRYQACTTQRCYPPKKQEVILSIEVVPSGNPVKALHPELFQPALP
jgi:cytochrome c biogenesis DsbD-like protein